MYTLLKFEEETVSFSIGESSTDNDILIRMEDSIRNIEISLTKLELQKLVKWINHQIKNLD